MKKVILVPLAMLMFSSCSKDQRLRKYEQIVNDSDQIRFLVYGAGDFQIVRDVTDRDELKRLKNILIMDIQTEDPIKLFPNKKFEFVKNGQTRGHLLILDKQPDPCAVVKIEGERDFGFRLPYRIGMYPD